MSGNKFQHIADEVIRNESVYIDATYVGKMFGKELYHISKNLTGHVGLPIFILIDDKGDWEYLEGTLNIFEAMEMRNNK